MLAFFDSEVQLYGCFALGNLAESDAGSDLRECELLDLRGVRAMQKATRFTPHVEILSLVH
jgi:hypothetical protein